MNLWHNVIHPITGHFRGRRGQFLRDNFPNIQSAKICDLGGSRHFWEKLGIEVPPYNITIYNVSESETSAFTDAYDIKVVIYDGKRIPVPDNAFDLLMCNSVIEHVPPDLRLGLAKEMRRVARQLFLQTPARSFVIEPHFIMPFVHWLPRSLGYQLIKISPWRLLARPSAAEIHDYWWGTKLLNRRELEQLFPEANITSEGVLGLTKSYYVVSKKPA